MPRRTAAERFAEKINKSGPWSLIKGVPGQCWIWTGVLNEHGYGRFRDDTGRRIMTHRWAWEQANGPVPDGLVCDHLCRVRACANPDHIEPVTSRVNTLRGETIAAANAAKTACVNGHEYTAETTIVRPNGSRQCRTCHRANSRARNAERYANDPEYRERERARARESMRRSRERKRAAAREQQLAPVTPITPHTTDTDLERAA